MQVEHGLIVRLQYHLEHFIFPNEVLTVRIRNQLLSSVLFQISFHQIGLVVHHLLRLTQHFAFGLLHLFLDVFEFFLVWQNVDVQHESAVFDQFVDQQFYQGVRVVSVFFVSLGVSIRNLLQLVLVDGDQVLLCRSQVLFFR